MRWTRSKPGGATWLEEGATGDAWLVPETFTPYETDSADGLAIRLATAAPDRGGMAAFTARYGLLDEVRIHDGRRAGSLAEWRRVREDARYLLGAWFDDAPGVPHDPALRLTFAGAAAQPRQPAHELLSDLLVETRFTLGPDGLWPVGPTLHAQLWGELAVRVATARPFALCSRCGAPFVYRRISGLYCSNTCRIMAGREKRAA